MPIPSVRVQVICTGHELSQESRQKLMLDFPNGVQIITEHLHIKRWEKVEQELMEYYHRLKQLGATFNENVTTIIVPPGNGQGAMLIPPMWQSITGQWPWIFNLMFRGEERGYCPVPELPYIKIHEVRNRLRLQFRPNNMGKSEILKAPEQFKRPNNYQNRHMPRQGENPLQFDNRNSSMGQHNGQIVFGDEELAQSTF